jgi:serine/threonine protein kinase
VEPLELGDPAWVGKYRILGRLGSGGMGRVFLAQSPGGRRVAVKLIRSELAEDDDFRVRFAREVRAARQVSGAFTAPVIDADPHAPQPWLVTAYIDGPSLADSVSTHGPMPADAVVALAAGLAEGLEAIHAVGVVHRDLKPSNVLLASDGPRIIDFGIARAADSTWRTGSSDIIGSPGFMSPEQAKGLECGPPSDIFSLGAVLTYVVTGEGPFGIGTPEALLYRVVHGQPVTNRIPAQLRPMIESCLTKEPQQRPTTGELLAGSELLRSRAQRTLTESAVNNAKTVSLPPNDPTKVQPRYWTLNTRQRFTSRRWLLTACAAVVLAGAMAAGFIMTSDPPASFRPGPATVVRAFYAAINNHDWRRVWCLWHDAKYRNCRPSQRDLSGVMSGYRCTVHDEIKELSVSGRTVSGRLIAHEAHDGVKTEQTFSFKYLVSDGVIKSGSAPLLAGRAPPGCRARRQ